MRNKILSVGVLLSYGIPTGAIRAAPSGAPTTSALPDGAAARARASIGATGDLEFLQDDSAVGSSSDDALSLEEVVQHCCGGLNFLGGNRGIPCSEFIKYIIFHGLFTKMIPVPQIFIVGAFE